MNRCKCHIVHKNEVVEVTYLRADDNNELRNLIKYVNSKAYFTITGTNNFSTLYYYTDQNSASNTYGLQKKTFMVIQRDLSSPQNAIHYLKETY